MTSRTDTTPPAEATPEERLTRLKGLLGGQTPGLGGDPRRQPRLAQAARTGQREQPGAGEQPPRFGHLPLAPDETCHLRRQVPRLPARPCPAGGTPDCVTGKRRSLP